MASFWFVISSEVRPTALTVRCGAPVTSLVTCNCAEVMVVPLVVAATFTVPPEPCRVSIATFWSSAFVMLMMPSLSVREFTAIGTTPAVSSLVMIVGFHWALSATISLNPVTWALSSAGSSSWLLRTLPVHWEEAPVRFTKTSASILVWEVPLL